jgi:hypothetical protein
MPSLDLIKELGIDLTGNPDALEYLTEIQKDEERAEAEKKKLEEETARARIERRKNLKPIKVRLVVIAGETRSGKTTLVKSIVKKFGHPKTVIYGQLRGDYYREGNFYTVGHYFPESDIAQGVNILYPAAMTDFKLFLKDALPDFEEDTTVLLEGIKIFFNMKFLDFLRDNCPYVQVKPFLLDIPMEERDRRIKADLLEDYYKETGLKLNHTWANRLRLTCPGLIKLKNENWDHMRGLSQIFYEIMKSPV